MTIPSTNADTSSPVLGHTTNDCPLTASSGSRCSHEDPVIENDGRGTESLSALSPSSRSSGPPNSHHNGPSPAYFRPNVPLSQHDTEGKGEFPGVSPPASSPPYEDATPPYSTTINTKEAEAAAERSLSASQDRRPSLPAYQSPIQESAPPVPFQPSAIVPVADLSARRREEDKRPPSRPFSFVATYQEDVLYRHTASKESQHTSGTTSSLSKELGLEGDETSNAAYSRLSPRPLNDSDLGLHPALRGPVEKPIISQNRNQGSPPSTQNQQEEQYRIPGPYGQQLRPIKPLLISSDAGQVSFQQPPHSAPLAKREQVADHPSLINDKHRSLDVPVKHHLLTTEYHLSGMGPPLPPKPSNLTSRERTGAAKLFHPHPKSGLRRADNDHSHLQESAYKEEKIDDKHGSMFRLHNRRDSGSTSSQFGSTRVNASRSQSALEFRRLSPDLQAHDVVQRGTKTKGKDQKFSRKLQRMTTSKHQTETPPKKKGGFLRLSGLFGKSGKESIPPAKEEPSQRAVAPESIFHTSVIRGPSPASSMPRQDHQNHLRGQASSNDHGDQREDSFQGQAPPVGGYYAPINQIADQSEHQPRRLPLDPNSFIGGRRLTDQRAAEQARHLESIVGVRGQYPTPYQPQAQPNAQPQSAPPSTQHFNTGAPQQPRAASQRFPPDLRIDTSGRPSPNRRSQPLPVTGARAMLDSTSGGRAPFTEIPTNVTTPHTSSNPQRHSPYTDRNSQHSPYGYGTARGLRKDNLSHAIDLHKRSRSPRNGRRESFDSPEERINAHDPASRLGTFSDTHRSRSQRGASGDNDEGQEKPWKIDLPVAGDPHRRAAGTTHELPPTWAAAANTNANPPVELPGGPDAPDSDEEIVMSSTAWPGQEWIPEMQAYGHWDDHGGRAG